MEIRYRTEIIRNERQITAVLGEDRCELVKGLTQPDIKLPFVNNDKLIDIKFTYSFSEETRKTYVNFTLHRFVKNISTVEKLIEAADKLLESYAK
ncbi:MAG: hypothetical protein IPK06_04810 [Ignavibacteriae bacterium]|nr:hypothetical protein [Ignavibacteriota bacterium]